MTHGGQRLRRIIAFAVFATILASGGASATVAKATPERSFSSGTTGSRVELGAVRVGSARASLLATNTSLAVDDPFSYTAQVHAASPLSYLQVRMRLMSPDGRLIYQKTFIEQNIKRGIRSFVFERRTSDLGLGTRAYPLEISVVAVEDGSRSESSITSHLLTYDAERSPQRIALVARVGALPLADPQGRFILDPSSYTRARDDISSLAAFVLNDSAARITVSVSPMMLREWRQLADGYTYESPEGARVVPADSAVPREYARVLQALKLAVASGRMELLSTGLSDPDVSTLASEALVTDVEAQYAAGLSATFAAVETTASTGTAPAGGAMPAEAARRAALAGVKYAILDERFVRVGKQRAGAGVYQTRETPLLALVADGSAARAAVTSLPAAAISDLYRTYAQAKARPTAIVVTLGPEEMTAQQFTDLAKQMDAQPWVEPVLGREAASSKSKGLPKARITGEASSTPAPDGFWSAVKKARGLSRALTFALGAGAEDERLAENNTLIAEGSAWAGPHGDWTHVQRGLALAADATRMATTVLEKISLTVKPVTLAGTRGKVPITARNNGERPLKIILDARGTKGARVTGPQRRVLNLEPQDNFAEIPIDLQGGLSGTLVVRLVASGVTVSETTVPIRASIADRLVIIGGIVLLLGGMLAYIILRVRAAESGTYSDDDTERRYTQETHQGSAQ